MRLAVRPCEIVFQVIFGAVRLCQLSPNVEMGEGCGIRSLCFELSMRKESEGVECWRFDLRVCVCLRLRMCVSLTHTWQARTCYGICYGTHLLRHPLSTHWPDSQILIVPRATRCFELHLR